MLSFTKSRPSANKAGFAGKTLLQTLFFFLLVTQFCFAQWYPQNSGTTKNLNAVIFSDANNGLAVGDSGTVLRTNDGGTSWTPVITGITNNFTGMCFVDANKVWAITGIKSEFYNEFPDSGIILHSTDCGITWTDQITMPLTLLNDITFIDADNGWAVGTSKDSLNWDIEYSIILRTSNGGTTWAQQLIDTIPPVIGAHVPITNIDFVNSSTGWIISTSIGMGSASSIHKTTDGGNTWSFQFVTNGWRYSSLNDIIFRGFYGSGIAVGNLSINLGTSKALIISTSDGGANWSQILLDLPRLNDVFFLGWPYQTEGTIVGEEGVILRTADGGLSWEEQTSGTTNALSSVYFVDALNGWSVGNNGAILHTTNGGVPVELTTFTAIVNGKEVILNWSTATELNNYGFEIQRKALGGDFATVAFVKEQGTTTQQNQYSFADKNLDEGKYFYRLKQVDFSGTFEYSKIIEVELNSVLVYSLGQNFPNPFNPSTKISWQSPVSGRQVLKVFDVLGNEIATLVDEEQEAGSYEIEFNAEKLSSGVYFYQLKVYPANGGAGSFVETRKMILLR